MSLKTILLSTIGLAAATAVAFAALAETAEAEKKDDDAKWDVMNPPGDSREIDIDVDNGTWMSLDVSPDGKTIAFDMLGDIYTCLLYTSPSPRDKRQSRMPSSA